MKTYRVAALVAALALILPAPEAVAARPLARERPNVVLIYVDDMRLDDLAYMDYTRRLFASEGSTFTNGISPHPLCCPARAELMTGQYAQNNGVYHNGGTRGGHAAFKRAGMRRLLPQWFHQAGYQTGYVGKYLNGYNGGGINGVDVTDALVKNVYHPTKFQTWNNGKVTDRRQHTTDWTGFRTGKMIKTFRSPFFITSAYLAPHTMRRDGGKWVAPFRMNASASTVEPPPIPPKRYRTIEPGDEVPPSFSDPAFDEDDMRDKPSHLPRRRVERRELRTLHEGRVLSLYAVDDAVRRTVRALKDAGVYHSTVIAFTSDNGYLLGEHRLDGKDQPYHQALRVPFLLTGPRVPTEVNRNVVTTVDMPRTLAALAGVQPNRRQDGINALGSTPDRAVLIQSGSRKSRFDWRGVYTRNLTYVDHGAEIEAYDRGADPHELDSTPEMPQAGPLADLLTGLRDCRGAACQATSGP